MALVLATHKGDYSCSAVQDPRAPMAALVPTDLQDKRYMTRQPGQIKTSAVQVPPTAEEGQEGLILPAKRSLELDLAASQAGDTEHGTPRTSSIEFNTIST
ncbi:hypothetical protein V2G26_006911 [Clonostachys chloroleuca]